MREHGGNLDSAVQRFGGRIEDWIDLSTGINRQAYPVGEIEPHAWSALPSRSDIDSLLQAARQAYTTDASILAMAGAQAAIQCLPNLARGGRVRILAPTYNEYAGVLSATNGDVAEVTTFDALAGADLAIVVNPNNPDGRRHERADLLALLPRVGRSAARRSLDPALVREVLWAGRASPRLCPGRGRGYRSAFGNGGSVAGFGRRNCNRTARTSRSRMGEGDVSTARTRLRTARR